MRISVNLEAKTGSFETDLNRAAKAAEKRSREIEKAFKQAGKVIGTSLVAAGGALALMTRNATIAAREFDNLAGVSGTSSTEFQRLANAAKSVGVEQDKLADIFKDTQDKVGDFLNTGGGPLADFFEKIAPQVEVTAEQFRNLSGPQALQLYASSLEKANLSQSEMTFYMEAIASDATSLLPLLKDGGLEFDRLGDAAERTGAILDQQTSQALNQVQKNADQLHNQFQGLQYSIVRELAPSLEALSNDFMDAANQGDFAARSAEGISYAFKGATLGVIALANGVQILGKTLAGVAAVNVEFFTGNFRGAIAAGSAALEDIQGDIEDVQRSYDSLFNSQPLSPASEGPVAPRAGIAPPRSSRATEEATKATKRLAEATSEYDRILALHLALAEEDEGRQRELNRLFEEASQVFDATRTPLENFNKEIERLNVLRDTFVNGKPLIDPETYERAVAQANEALDGLGKKAKDVTDDMTVYADQAARNMQDAFADFLFDPFEDGLSGLLKSFEQTLRKMAAQAAASEIFKKLDGLGNDDGKFGFDDFAGIVGSVFGGPRAAGGPVSAGKTYLVGENGPELFVSPSTGMIIPNHQVGDSSTTINQSFSITSNGPVSRATEQQLAAAAARGAQRASARNN